MKISELQNLYESRFEGENLTETWQRIKEHSLLTSQEKTPQIDVSYDEDLPIPRIKVIQNSCQMEDATPGRFRNLMSDEEFEKLDNVVFLMHQSSRSLFAEGDFSGQKRCWSNNGYTPATNVKERTKRDPIAPQCAMKKDGKIVFTCPMAQWRNSQGQPDHNGNQQPICKPTIVILGIHLVSKLPFWMTFHGAAIPEIKSFLKFVKYKREERKRQGQQLKLYEFKLSLKLELVVSKKGKFFIPKITSKDVIQNPKTLDILKQSSENLEHRFMALDYKET